MSKKVILSYDLETSGLYEFDGNDKCEIVQFSCVVLNEEFEEVETINIFHNTPIGEYLTKTNGPDYQRVVTESGMASTEFYSAIISVFIRYNVVGLMGHNITTFDNKVLKWHLNSKYLLHKVKIYDTRMLECLIVGCDIYGNVPGSYDRIKTTLEACCNRWGVLFDPLEAHDGLYDCTKSTELYLRQNKWLEIELLLELEK